MTEHNRILWACRRGMLECDLFLIPFAEQHYPLLNEEEKAAFERLLALPDQTLYRYFMNQETTDDSAFQSLIAKIVALKGRI